MIYIENTTIKTAKSADCLGNAGLVQHALIEFGWRVATVWECALRNVDQVKLTADILAKWLPTNELRIEVG